MSDSLQTHGLWPTRLLGLWDFTGKSTGVGCHFLLQFRLGFYNYWQPYLFIPIIKAGEGGNKGWDGCMASPTQWTGV